MKTTNYKIVLNSLIELANQVFAHNYYELQNCTQLAARGGNMTLNEVLKCLRVAKIEVPEHMEELQKIEVDTFKCTFETVSIFDILKKFSTVEPLQKNFVFAAPGAGSLIDVKNVKNYCDANNFNYNTENIYVDYSNGYKIATNGVILKGECIPVETEKENIFVNSLGSIAENQDPTQAAKRYTQIKHNTGVFFNFNYKFLKGAKDSVKIEILNDKTIINIEGFIKEYELKNENTAVFELTKKQIETIQKEKINSFYLCEKTLIYTTDLHFIIMYCKNTCTGVEVVINYPICEAAPIVEPTPVFEVSILPEPTCNPSDVQKYGLIPVVETTLQTIETRFIALEPKKRVNFRINKQILSFAAGFIFAFVLFISTQSLNIIGGGVAVIEKTPIIYITQTDTIKTERVIIVKECEPAPVVDVAPVASIDTIQKTSICAEILNIETNLQKTGFSIVASQNTIDKSQNTIDKKFNDLLNTGTIEKTDIDGLYYYNFEGYSAQYVDKELIYEYLQSGDIELFEPYE